MADPVEEQIVANIVSTLEDINTGNGYYTNAGHRVLKYLEGWQQPDGDTLPCLYVVGGDEDPRVTGLGGNCYTSETRYVVYCYVEQKPGNNDLADLLIRAKADIKVAMMTDGTRGGLASTTEMLEFGTDNGEVAPRGIVAGAFIVKYSWSLAAP